MVRGPWVDKNGLKKGAWSEEEDNKLRNYVLRYGHWNWRQLPRFAGLSRCGKSCRLRWMNYLKPGVKRGGFTKDEDETIIRLYKELGSRWSIIASKLPGRSDNDIKNHWHTHLKKRYTTKQDPKMSDSSMDHINEFDHQYGPSDQAVDDDQSIETIDHKKANEKINVNEDCQSAIFDAISPYSTQGTSSSFNSNSPDTMSCSSVTEEGTILQSQSFEETSFECLWDDMTFEGGLLVSKNHYSMVDQEFLLPYSLFGDDDINFLNNFIQ